MIDPVYLLVLEDETEVFEEGHGQQPATRVAVTDFYSDYRMLPDKNRPAYKAYGANGKVYIPQESVRYIVDLSGDEFRPITEEK